MFESKFRPKPTFQKLLEPEPSFGRSLLISEAFYKENKLLFKFFEYRDRIFSHAGYEHVPC